MTRAELSFMGGRMVLGAMLLIGGGCAGRATITQDNAQQEQILAELLVAGPWSTPAAGLRCRLLLDRDQAQETAFLRGAMAIQNVSDRPLTLSSSTTPPFSSALQWQAGQVPMDAGPTPATPAASAVRLEPGQMFITPPASLLLPPGEGTRPISAQLLTPEQTLTPPPLVIATSPAPWGPPTQGLRMRLALPEQTYTVGQRPIALLFIHNLTAQPITIHPPDWSTQRRIYRDDVIALACKIDDTHYVQIAPGSVWWQPVPTDALLLAPGTYRLRLILDAPEQPIDHQPAWHGKLTSNDAPLEAVARQ